MTTASDWLRGPFQVLVVTDGQGSIEGEFGSERIGGGDTFVLPAGLDHRLHAEQPASATPSAARSADGAPNASGASGMAPLVAIGIALVVIAGLVFWLTRRRLS